MVGTRGSVEAGMDELKSQMSQMQAGRLDKINAEMLANKSRIEEEMASSLWWSIR